MQTTKSRRPSNFKEFKASRKNPLNKKRITSLQLEDHQKYFMEEKEKEKEIKRLLLLKQYVPPKPVKLDDIMMKFDYYNFEEL
jgi:hypothetical protein